MKTSILLFILFSTILSSSCQKENDTISYPATFTYNNTELGTSHYFVVENQSPQTISVSGNLAEFEPYLIEELGIANFEFTINEVTLLSENEVELVFVDEVGGPIDTVMVLNYIDYGNTIRIFLDDEFIDMEFHNQQSQLRICIQASIHPYLDFQNQVDYNFEIDLCSTDDIMEIATEIIQNNSLVNNDSIAINKSYFVFD